MWPNGIPEKLTLLLTVLVFAFLNIACTIHSTYVVNHSPRIIKHLKYRKSVVRLSTMPGPKGYHRTSATGFAISPDHLLTAGHFCNTQKKARKKGKTGKTIQVEVADKAGVVHVYAKAKVLASAKDMDACLLESKDHKLTPLLFLSDLRKVETEDKVTVLGAPRGYFPVRADGYIISRKGEPSKFAPVDQSLIILHLDIEPGNSGSPVIWNDTCIGMVVKYMKDLHNGSLAARSDDILDFVSRHINLNKLNQGE